MQTQAAQAFKQNQDIIAMAMPHIDDSIMITDEFKPDQNLYIQSNSRVSRWEDVSKRSTRLKKGWQPAHLKSFTPQCFSQFPKHYTQLEIEIWIRRHRIDDLQKRITVQDFEANDPDIRSQSPEPIYDAKTGLRANTREQRHRDRYIKERLRLIDEVLGMDETYVPPPDYKPPKKQKKIYIPDPENPSVNFIGQIIGPSGTTQQKLEKESKCKISIRGKGSQSRVFNPDEREDEPLHVLVTADRNDDLEKGCAMIEAIIHQTDEAKKLQIVVYDHIGGMRKVWCESCGQQGHKFYECPEKLLSTNADVWCEICNSGTHPTNDCPKKGSRDDHRTKGRQPYGALAIEDNPDEELHQFLKEVKEGKQGKGHLQVDQAAQKQITYVSATEDQKNIQMIPADEEEAKKLQVSIALYNQNVGGGQNQSGDQNEFKNQLLKQQIQSLQAIQHSEVKTSKAFRSYKEPLNQTPPESPKKEANQQKQMDVNNQNDSQKADALVIEQPQVQEPGLYDAYWQQLYMQQMYQSQYGTNGYPGQYYQQQQAYYPPAYYNPYGGAYYQQPQGYPAGYANGVAYPQQAYYGAAATVQHISGQDQNAGFQQNNQQAPENEQK